MGAGSASDWNNSSMLSNMESAAKEMVVNITTATPKACHVAFCLNTPQSACSIRPMLITGGRS